MKSNDTRLMNALKKCPGNKGQAYVEGVLLPFTVFRGHDLFIIAFPVSSTVKAIVDGHSVFAQ